MIIQGIVETGIGDFGKWIARLLPYYERKTGLLLYPGTLNVRLRQAFELPKKRIRLEAHEYEGSVSVSSTLARIFGRKAVIPRTDANEAGTGHHSREVVEVTTDICLREAYHLHDGDMVSIEGED